MRHFIALTATASFIAPAAFAQVTAEDVWTNINAPAKAMGFEVSATTTRTGNRLEIGETTTSIAIPFDLGHVTFVNSGMALVENGDGTVGLEYPSMYEGKFLVEGPEGVLATARFEMDMGQYEVSAAGVPGKIGYAYTLAAGTFRLTDFSASEFPDFALEMTGTMADLAGDYQVTEGALTQVTGKSRGGEMRFDATMTVDSGVTTNNTQTSTFGTNTFAVDIPAGQVDILNLSQALRNGLSLTGTAEDTRTVTSEQSTLNGEVIVTQDVGYLTDTLTYTLDQSGLSGGGRNSDIWMEFDLGALFPVPIKINADAMTGAMVIPLNQGDAPVDASLSMGIEALEVSEDLWALIDPEAQLPRDAANLELDVSGKAALLMDLLDINALMALETTGPNPAELHALDINTLELDMAGAAVSATGAFTFDNSDLETFGGFPAPDGALNIDIAGANALIDKLVAIGLASDEDAMGARMAMGVVAIPGDGEDTLTSVIEVKPDGQILANGQRLK